ncbi:MAG: AAA family ATPase [Polyangiaceae bacterium]|nr:AAA family ATPase [Polyangiaceae bacterium]
MIRTLHIQNYKSIVDHSIELGRLNVFIGENGCGKTNLLEAVAMAGAASIGKVDTEELHSRGVRIARPSITLSSFQGQKAKKKVRIDLALADEDNKLPVFFEFMPVDPESITTEWAVPLSSPTDEARDKTIAELNAKLSETADTPRLRAEHNREYKKALAKLTELLLGGVEQRGVVTRLLSGYAIYNITAPALRGIVADSRREPLGIYGENLDVVIASLPKSELQELITGANLMGWFDSLFLDTDDALKLKGYKLGRSTSRLYFRDKFMRRAANILSAENANEGVLHVLFYLTLFLSKKTPAFLRLIISKQV